MNKLKSILFSIFGFLAVGGMVTLSSCEQDPCAELNCQHDGVCSNGYCQCPEGYEGAECDITSASRFTGTFVGNMRCDKFPIKADTITIELMQEPDSIKLMLGTGNTSVLSMYAKAQTPETHFYTHVDDMISLHAYITVDGHLHVMNMQTINNQLNTKQICNLSRLRLKATP